MIKHEQSGMKVAIFNHDDLGDENFCLKLYSNGTAHFITVDKAIILSNLIQKAVNQYFKEHPEKVMEQYIEP
jgi:hypothetical protein